MEPKTTAAWSDELKLGIEAVDGEHRLQIALLDAFQAALSSGGDRTVTSEILARLDDYTNVHFMGEELMMRLHSYPGYGMHVEEHRRLVEQLRSLRGRYEARADAEAMGVLDELRRWLAGHIQTADRGFARFVANGGAAAE